MFQAFLLILMIHLAFKFVFANASACFINLVTHLIRPQTYPSKENENSEDRKNLKKRSELENEDSRILVYQDEVHFQIQTTVTSAWYQKGIAPTVKSFPGHSKVSYSGFVIPQTGELFVATPERFNYETTIASIRSFLETCPPPEGKKYALVMDHAPWHKKAIRLIADEHLDEYSDIFNKIEFIKLPPYSTDLNPIEQVWRITRRENTHDVFFNTLSKFMSTIDKAFEAWASPTPQIRALCSSN